MTMIGALDASQVLVLALGIVVVLAAAKVGGRLFARLGQPRVVGEVIAGICLGPTLLGRSASEWLFPLEGRPVLKALSTAGLVAFMFVLGVEMDPSALRGRGRRIAAGVVVAGTVVPLGLGVALATVLHPTHAVTGFPPFALFIGAAMSVTAFPVLARILIERGIYATPLGSIAMAGAAGDDALTWIKLVAVVAIVTASGGWALVTMAALLAAFVAVVVLVVRPLLARIAQRAAGPATMLAILAGLAASAWATHAIGIHEIFGAFIFGAAFPRGSLAEQLPARFAIATRALLPMFFVTTGLGVDVGGIGAAGAWQLPLIVVVACAGKVLGGAVGARSQGLAMRGSLALGVLMNTRGLTELVVLNIGLSVGVLDPSLFTMLVVMAIVTTVATGPLLDLIKPDPMLGMTAPSDPASDLRRVIRLDEARARGYTARR